MNTLIETDLSILAMDCESENTKNKGYSGINGSGNFGYWIYWYGNTSAIISNYWI